MSKLLIRNSNDIVLKIILFIKQENKTSKMNDDDLFVQILYVTVLVILKSESFTYEV